MTDHAWTQEHIAAYVAGGLDAAEAERLELHIRDCADCAAALVAAKRLDRDLDELFAGVRPGVALEDRAVVSLRTVRRRERKPLMAGWARRATVAIAAVLILGTFGAMAGSLLNDGLLPMPGNVTTASAPPSPVVVGEGGPDPVGKMQLAEDGRNSGKVSGIVQSGIDLNSAKNPAGDSSPAAGGEPGRGQEPGRAPPLRPNDYAAALHSVPPQRGGAGFGGGGQGGFGGGGLGGFGGGIQGGFGGGQGGFGGGMGGFGGGGFGGGGFGGFGGGGMNPPPNYPVIPGKSGAPGTPNAAVPPGAMFSTDGKNLPKNSKTGAVAAIEPGTSTGSGAVPPRLDLNYYQPGTNKPKPAEGESKDLNSLELYKNPSGRDQDKPQKPDDPKQQNIPQIPAEKGQPPVKEPAPQASRRIVIRSGDMEFEVNSFDAAVATITKLVAAIDGAFVATVNSEKLPNGKVKGSITVRTPPEHLDALVLDLRKDLGQQGELKGVKIGSQDITRQYTDLESRLKAARTMEERLLQIIKEGKGEIKQLLEAERELGVWRTKIEETEGEIRYLGNLASLSTLTITLAEKEIRTAAGVTENERVQAGVEVEDVDKAYQDVLGAVLKAKGRVTKSELKQLAAGQFNATLHFELSPEAAGPMRDRLRQLGKVARLEIDRVQQTDGTPVPKDAKVKHGDTAFLVQLYNLANIAPRETTTMQVAAEEVPAAYVALREAVEKAKGRILNAQLSEQDQQNITAQLDFEVRRPDEGAVRAALEGIGDVASRQVTRAPESDTVTDTKVLYRVTLLSASRLSPRESTAMQIAVSEVPAAYNSLREVVEKAKGRVITAQLNEQERQNITAQLDFEVRRADEGAVRAALEAAGEVGARQVTRAPEGGSVTDAKVLYRVTLLSANRLSPREITSLSLEVANVDQTAAAFTTHVAEVKGRKLDSQSKRDPDGRVTARLVYEVPLAAAPGLVEQFKSAAGTVRAYQTVRDPQAIDGKFATARIDVTLTNEERIVAADQGLWSQVRSGLAYSAKFLLTSVTWIIFGLCVVLPWAVVGFVGYRMVRWLFRSRPVPVPVTNA